MSNNSNHSINTTATTATTASTQQQEQQKHVDSNHMSNQRSNKSNTHKNNHMCKNNHRSKMRRMQNMHTLHGQQVAAQQHIWKRQDAQQSQSILVKTSQSFNQHVGRSEGECPRCERILGSRNLKTLLESFLILHNVYATTNALSTTGHGTYTLVKTL